MKTQQSLFVTLEGIEGSGKTTLAHKLLLKFQHAGLDAIYIREPGGCTVSEKIRDLLLSSENDISPEAELMLFMASRAETVSKIIIPALDRGICVIGDRHIDSSTAYQGYGRGIEIETIAVLNSFTCQKLLPDITFLLHLPVEVGLGRQQKTDRISREQIEFHERVSAGFLEISKLNKKRFHILDAEQSAESVVDMAWNIVSKSIQNISNTN